VFHFPKEVFQQRVGPRRQSQPAIGQGDHLPSKIRTVHLQPDSPPAFAIGVQMVRPATVLIQNRFQPTCKFGLPLGLVVGVPSPLGRFFKLTHGHFNKAVAAVFDGLLTH